MKLCKINIHKWTNKLDLDLNRSRVCSHCNLVEYPIRGKYRKTKVINGMEYYRQDGKWVREIKCRACNKDIVRSSKGEDVPNNDICTQCMFIEIRSLFNTRKY